MPEPDLLALMQSTFLLNQQGAAVLGTWVVLNFVGSGVLWQRSVGFIRHFHQMNLAWNLVNLLLIAFTLRQVAPSAISAGEMIALQYFNEKIYLFNAGLDIGYLLLGLFLAEKAKTAAKRGAMLKGFGHSIVLQGMFLLVFDWALFYLHTELTERMLNIIGL